jgi:hypothetical protein
MRAMLGDSHWHACEIASRSAFLGQVMQVMVG